MIAEGFVETAVRVFCPPYKRQLGRLGGPDDITAAACLAGIEPPVDGGLIGCGWSAGPTPLVGLVMSLMNIATPD